MRPSIEFTLLADGSSDSVLIEPLAWLLRQLGCGAANGTWADLRRLRQPPKALRSRIEAALDLYPCDLLFVHRDAEKGPPEERIAEIDAARNGLATCAVPVVPVRMQEAWLLIDEAALRRAAGNPNGPMPLAMPSLPRPPARRCSAAGGMTLATPEAVFRRSWHGSEPLGAPTVTSIPGATLIRAPV
jgi:hypothetical protein